MFAKNNVLGLTTITAMICGIVLMVGVMLMNIPPFATASPPPYPDAHFQPVGVPPDTPQWNSAHEHEHKQDHGQTTHTDITLIDATRHKDLPVRVYYPNKVGNESLAIIVFSHGFGGDREVAPELMQHWARHGFVVLCPTHEDSVRLRRYAGKDISTTSMLLEFGMIDEGRLSRVQDCSFILDSLTEVEQEVPILAGRLDVEHIGIGGHSAGALTAMLLAGAKNDLPSGKKQYNLRDERFNCVIVLSGQGVGNAGFTESSWDEMILPMMVMSGTQDYSVGKQQPEGRCDPFTYSPAGEKYLLWFDGATHNSFTGKAAELQQALTNHGELSKRQRLELITSQESEDSLQRSDHIMIFAAVQKASLLFWTTYLRGDSHANQWLVSNDAKHEFPVLKEYSNK